MCSRPLAWLALNFAIASLKAEELRVCVSVSCDAMHCERSERVSAVVSAAS